MANTPTDDNPGVAAGRPERRHACYRLVQPAETYFLTAGQGSLCAAYFSGPDANPLIDELLVMLGVRSCWCGVTLSPLRFWRARFGIHWMRRWRRGQGWWPAGGKGVMAGLGCSLASAVGINPGSDATGIAEHRPGPAWFLWGVFSNPDPVRPGHIERKRIR